MSGRHARVCLEHKRIAETQADGALFCPAGHTVAEEQEGIYDRVDGTYKPLEPSTQEEKPMPRPVGRPRKLRLAAEPAQLAPTPKPKKKGVLERTKFVDEKGAVLYIRLEAGSWGYAVRWERREDSHKDSRREKGFHSIEQGEDAGRAAYAKALRDAEKNAWQEAAITRGRSPELVPIPLANLGRKPGRKKKRAA
jgi:hypothetical protein